MAGFGQRIAVLHLSDREGGSGAYTGNRVSKRLDEDAECVSFADTAEREAGPGAVLRDGVPELFKQPAVDRSAVLPLQEITLDQMRRACQDQPSGRQAEQHHANGEILELVPPDDIDHAAAILAGFVRLDLRGIS